MSYARSDPDELISSINVTPLVDVVLVLLVVLMVTGSYVASRSIPIEPPTAHRTEASLPSVLEVSIDRTGALFVDGVAADEATLRERALEHASRSEHARVILAADRATAHGDVVRALDVLHDASIDRVSIRVREVAR